MRKKEIWAAALGILCCMVFLGGCRGGGNEMPAGKPVTEADETAGPENTGEETKADQSFVSQKTENDEAGGEEKEGPETSGTEAESEIREIKSAESEAGEEEDGYSDEELADMARAYFRQKEGTEPQYAEVSEIENSYAGVTVWLYDIVDEGKETAHGVTRASYSVNRRTGQGTDVNFEPVDLTDVLEDGEPEDKDFYSAAVSADRTEVERFAKKVKQQVLNRDWAAVAEEIAYPALVDGNTYQNSEEFLAADFESDLNPYFFVALEEENCEHMFCSWQGVMMGSGGEIWLTEARDGESQTPELKIMTINHLTGPEILPGEVGMQAEEGSITPTSMTLTLYNETELSICFGDDYQLKKQVGEEWHILEPAADFAYNDIAYEPKRGQPVEWKVDWSQAYGSLEDGTYGITKTVTDMGSEGQKRTFERTFQFLIGEPR